MLNDTTAGRRIEMKLLIHKMHDESQINTPTETMSPPVSPLRKQSHTDVKSLSPLRAEFDIL